MRKKLTEPLRLTAGHGLMALLVTLYSRRQSFGGDVQLPAGASRLRQGRLDNRFLMRLTRVVG
jgi:hypothetical protein